jgi:transposase InsO family protein
MQRRQKMVEQVLGQGMSISAAARAAGVSRQSASLWVARAREQGIAHLSEASRRPHRVRPGVSPEVERQVLLFQSQHPAWGAKKLHAGLWPPEAQQAPPLCARTVGRILQRAGLRAQPPVSSRSGACQNFERLHCNALWQLDFKGLELSHAFRPLSILDDASRYCIALMAVARPRGRSVGQTADELLWEKLWSAFACYGLPEAILCDNGDGFNGNAGVGLTPFEMRLARLGIRVLHGRAYHPQTQGKIERFHRTLEAEWPHLLRVPFEQAPDALEEVRQSYNWLRPHEALGQRKPGSLYTPSARARPDNLPPAGIAANAVTRKVDGDGFISFRGNSYRMGRGLCGERVEIRGEHGADGELNHTAFYSGQRLDTLENIGAKGRNRIQTTPPKSVKDVLS